MRESSPIISFENVTFSYNRHPVFSHATFLLQEGTFATIVGPNGSGKTTLLKLILGLLEPDRGTIHVFQKSPQESSPQIGYVPQHIQYDTLFPISVMDVVLMGRIGPRGKTRYSVEDKEAARAALEEMELLPEAHSLFSSLSGGQRQRALIARALCTQPKLLLMDEPTANVDMVVERKLLSTLKALNQRMTILLISHDLGFVSQYVDSVICVHSTIKVHPTSEITGEVIKELYGADVQMVRHDHHVG